MSEPLSRSKLEEAVELWKITPHIYGFVSLMAQAILDAPTVEWCEAHGACVGYVIAKFPKDKPVSCWAAGVSARPDTPCQFATYVRVKVSE